MSDQLKTALSTGPGFYAANTSETDKNVKPGMMRFYTARLQAYDGPLRKGTDIDGIEFMLLVAMAEGNPAIARALLELHSSIGKNLEFLKGEAAK